MSVVALLESLVAIPSVSGDEQAIAAFVETWFRTRGLEVRRDDRNLEVRVRGAAPGPVLLLSSHLDVVPTGTGWATDPFTPVIRDGRMFGRGCNDAKASVAALCHAMLALAHDPPARGEIVLALTCEEERGRNGLERFLPSLGRVDAALVGEPT